MGDGTYDGFRKDGRLHWYGKCLYLFVHKELTRACLSLSTTVPFGKKGCYVKGKKLGFGTYVGKGDKWSL